MDKNFKILFCILGGIILSLSPMFGSSLSMFAVRLGSGTLFNIVNLIAFGVYILSFIGFVLTVTFSIILVVNNINFNKR
jgi:hypothetical protein